MRSSEWSIAVQRGPIFQSVCEWKFPLTQTLVSAFTHEVKIILATPIVVQRRPYLNIHVPIIFMHVQHSVQTTTSSISVFMACSC